MNCSTSEIIKIICILNVNIPSGEIKGTKITRLGERKYENSLVERVNPYGKRYFWIGGDVKEVTNGRQ